MAGYQFAVVGDPVAHSRSPEIHRVLFQLTGLEGEYRAVRTNAQGLRSVVDGLRHGEWDGLNVTMPLKGEAAELADHLTADAERAGSVNTLLVREGRVRGDTTDCATFRRLLEDSRLRDRRAILVLGAGGSAAAALAAVTPGESIYVESRHDDRTKRVTDRLGGQVLSWGSPVAGALLINATPLGMKSEALPNGLLEVAAAVIDLPYGSKPTPTVTAAQQQGLPAVDGHEFLIRQAMASFTLWTGADLTYEPVAAALRKL